MGEPRIDATDLVDPTVSPPPETTQHAHPMPLEGQLMPVRGRKWSPEEKAAIVARVVEERAEEGTTMKQLALANGVSYATLLLWCIEEMPEEYRDAQKRANLMQMVEAQIGLEEADNHVELHRCRELLVHARWIVERTNRDRFAQRTEVTGANGGPVQLTDMDRERRIAFLKRVLDESTREGSQ